MTMATGVSVPGFQMSLNINAVQGPNSMFFFKRTMDELPLICFEFDNSLMLTLHSPKDVVDRLRLEAKIVWIHIICLYKVVLFSPPPRPDIKQVTGVFFSRWLFQL